MTKPAPERAARWVVAGWVALWLIVFAGSIVAPTTMAPTGDGFHRGMNRIATGLQIQAVALVLAIAAWIVTRRLRTRLTPPWVWLGRLPALTTLALAVIVALMVAIAIARA